MNPTTTTFADDCIIKGREQHLEELLQAARPNLIRFALARGVPVDGVEDVVQETLLEAWRHLDQLRASERFEAWLCGICRNVCLRWRSTQAKTCQQPLSLYQNAEGELQGVEAREHQLVLDPVDELSHKDFTLLLTRALGYLPDTIRTPLELHYLAELSQREVAQRLGLTIKAVEQRLQRARYQLRQVLSTSLRVEAEEFGLTIDQEVAAGWQETRIWCMFCGRAHLQGLLETFPDEQVNLRMRCPRCADQIGGEWIRTGALDTLRGIRTFRPALKHILNRPSWTTQAYRQFCSWCEGPVTTCLSDSEHLPVYPVFPRGPGLRWVRFCSSCGGLSTGNVGLSIIHHPAAQHFIKQHPRWLNVPETLINYESQPAVRVCLVDITSADQLIFLVDTQSGEILAIRNN